MTERSYRILLWSLAFLGLLLDQTTKYGVFQLGHAFADERQAAEARRTEPTAFSWQWRDGHPEYPVIPHCFEFLTQFDGRRASGNSFLGGLRTWGGETMPRVNHGALFGMDGGLGVSANSLFAVISLLAAAAIIYWSTQQSLARDWSLCAALGLILAGTLGNLYDRVVFDGVRDFIHWHYYEKFDWPVFNIADCCLVVGAGLLLTQAFWHRSAVPADKPASAIAETAVGTPAVAEVK